MKKDRIYSNLQSSSSGKRFSIKEFFKIAEPELIHWNKHSDEDEAILFKVQESNEQVKSIVRGMVNNIGLQCLDDVNDRMESCTK